MTSLPRSTVPFVEVALDLSKGLAADDRFRRLLAAVRRALPVEGGMLLRREGDLLRAIAIDGLQERALHMEFPLDNPAVAGVVGPNLPFRKVGRVGLLTAYQDVPDHAQPDGVLIGLPLMVEGELVGSLNLGARDPHAFDNVPDEDFLVYAALAAAAFRTANLLDALERESQLRQQIAAELQRDARRRIEGPLLGDSAAVHQLRAAVENAAQTDEPVLLLGPSGSGKEAVARAIHALGRRREGGFLHVSCALVRTGDEQLFGPQARRLLGRADANDNIVGKLDLAHGGTLFLDGADKLEQGVQLELARYLELRKSEGVAPDARLMVAVSANDARQVHRTLRRELGAVTIALPPLSERQSDVEAMAEHYLRAHARQRGVPVWELTSESRRLLTSYPWPGNVRELRNVIERAVALSRGDTLALDASLFESRPTLGSYTLLEPLGEGGMGQVWRARHRLLSRDAAVKVIQHEQLARIGDAAAILRRFEREARATAALRSPHTVHIYDFGVTEDGAFYYAMEHLSGMDLDSIVEQEGPLPPERVVYLLCQACASLAEAHAAALVHRDVKPANLFVCDGPEHDFVKVLDFGLVGVDDEEAAAAIDTMSTLRDPGAVDTNVNVSFRGTPAFIASEMLLGGSVDARADIYALGCVAYYALSGQLPCEGPDAITTALAHLHADPPPLSSHNVSVPRELEAVVRACLAKDPAARPPGAAALRRALESVPLKRPWDLERARGWWEGSKQ
ncbi:MAG TPA: sigma 54-interacting transcriptional regulator [Polyangiaceae bacterium]|nr:sigma 54-interacting transcriptional regulator [Polyangiaceae bacterium]